MTDKKKLGELKRVSPVDRLIRNMDLVNEMIKKIKAKNGGQDEY